jgi:anti-sigma B factor antagonist
MQFEISNQADYSIININELRMDASLAPAFKDFCSSNMQEVSTPIIIDLSHIRFMDSSGLGALIFCLKQTGDQYPVVLIGANESVCDLLELTSMHKLFLIEASVETALAKLKDT